MQVRFLLTPQPTVEVKAMSHGSVNSGYCYVIGETRNTAADRHVLSNMLPNAAGHIQGARDGQQARGDYACCAPPLRAPAQLLMRPFAAQLCWWCAA